MRTGQPQGTARTGVDGARGKATVTATAETAASANGSSLSGAELEMEIVKAVGDLELEYVTWSLPNPEPGEKRGRTKSASITPASLFEPGAYFLKSSSGSGCSWLKKRCSHFHTTISTRCVRDIKREFSWKIYGVCCNQESKAEAHYVRIKFATKDKDRSFASLVDLLNALAAKRFLRSSRGEGVHPFGIGFDCGVQKSKERLYVISNCAKQTPFLRRVGVGFEVQINGEWVRLDATVDRIGFATYKSAQKSSILAANTLNAINFKDDAYLRFARVTLRFGKQAERTVLDVGKNFEPQLIYTKSSAILTLNRIRVRTCEGTEVSAPVRTQARLVFTDIKEGRSRNGFRRGSFGKHCASEAEKVLVLLKKTVQIAGVNTLGLEDELDDDAIFQMNIQRVVTDPDFSIRAKGEIESTKMSLGSHFNNSTLFLVPCYRSNGVDLILQSRNGEYVLQQYVTGPVKFIGSITANCFAGPKSSTFRKVGGKNEYEGDGKVTYMFETCETDATALVETLVSIIEKLHNFQTAAGFIPGTSSIPPFVALPLIPTIPSIHLSRPATAITVRTSRNGHYSAWTPDTDIPPVPRIITTPPAAPAPTPAPAVAPAPAIAHTPTPVYKIPRKPVPSSRSRSTSSTSSNTTSTTPHSIRTPALVPSQQPLAPLSESPQGLLVPDPSAMPGGRLYELRASTLKHVITGLDTGLQGTVHTVSRV